MPTNKHAIIRYQALDACFSNKYKKFFIEDLVDACNKALEEFYYPKENEGEDESFYVKKRTIFNDIAYGEFKGVERSHWKNLRWPQVLL